MTAKAVQNSGDIISFGKNMKELKLIHIAHQTLDEIKAIKDITPARIKTLNDGRIQMSTLKSGIYRVGINGMFKKQFLNGFNDLVNTSFPDLERRWKGFKILPSTCFTVVRNNKKGELIEKCAFTWQAILNKKALLEDEFNYERGEAKATKAVVHAEAQPFSELFETEW